MPNGSEQTNDQNKIIMPFRNHLKNLKLIALLLLLMGAVFFTTLPFFNRGGGAVKDAYVGSVRISGMEYGEARALVEARVKEFQDTPLAIRANDGETVMATAREIGVEFSVESALEKAFTHGKHGTLVQKIYTQVRALVMGIQEPVGFVVNENRFQKFLNTQLSPLHHPAVNALFTYNYRTETFDFIPATEGTIIDVVQFKSDLAKSMGRLSTQPIYVVQLSDMPRVREEGIITAQQRAQKILEGMPYVLETDETTWEVEKDDIASWIVFEPSLREIDKTYYLTARISEEKIRDYLTPFAPGLNVVATNAEFNLQDDKVALFIHSEPGAELDIEASATAIKENIEKGQSVSSLVFNIVEPEITTASLNDLGITTLIGKGESDFAGSPSSRAHNISVGANKYQGVLVAASEEFSFNEILGPVTAREGYLPELVIKQNKTIPEYGGGLCQVSTTLFRAAVMAGLEITQRYNHSYPVAYYGTPGFDATIYPPNPDFRFRNTTPGHILLQYKIEGTKLIFEIYGTDDGRTIEIDGPYTYDEKPDGSMKAWVTQTVRNASGAIIQEKTFYSNYKSPANYPIDRNPLE